MTSTLTRPDICQRLPLDTGESRHPSRYMSFSVLPLSRSKSCPQLHSAEMSFVQRAFDFFSCVLSGPCHVSSTIVACHRQADLNAGPGSLPYGLQRSVAGLGDAFAESCPGEPGHTCEADDNVFANKR